MISIIQYIKGLITNRYTISNVLRSVISNSLLEYVASRVKYVIFAVCRVLGLKGIAGLEMCSIMLGLLEELDVVAHMYKEGIGNRE